MYKEGINLNTISEKNLVKLPGIGENLARSVILRRELKSEFVNPEEFKTLVPVNVFSKVSQMYNIYTVSASVWASRITSQKNHLYNEDCKILFTKESAIMQVAGNLFIFGLELEAFREKLYNFLGKKGFLHTITTFLGKKIPVKMFVIPEVPPLEYLENLLKWLDAEKFFLKFGENFVEESLKYERVSACFGENKIKELVSFSWRENFLEINTFVKNESCAIVIKYGSVKICLLFRVTPSFESTLLEKDEFKGIHLVWQMQSQISKTLQNFMGMPHIIEAGVASSDGNLIFCEK